MFNRKINTDLIWNNKQFLFVLAGYTLSIIGDNFTTIALNYWILTITGSAKLVSGILIIYIVMNLFLGSFAGTLADRFERRKLMLFTDLIRAILTISLAMTVSLGLPIFIVYLIVVLLAFFSIFNGPALQASIVDIVGKNSVNDAIGMMTLMDNIGRIVGFGLGGVLVAILGSGKAIALDACSFLISAVFIIMARKFPVHLTEKDSHSFYSDWRKGFQYIWQKPFTKFIILILPFLFMFFTSSLMLIQVISVKDWHANSFEFGLIEAAIPIGYFLGAFFLLFFKSIIQKYRWKLTMYSVMLLGPLYFIISMLDQTMKAIPFVIIIGILFSFSTMIFNILLRELIESEVQGRIFGILGSLTSIAPPFALTIISVLADRYGSAFMLSIDGVLMLIFGISTFIRMIGKEHTLDLR